MEALQKIGALIRTISLKGSLQSIVDCEVCTFTSGASAETNLDVGEVVVLSRQGTAPCASGDGVCFTRKASTRAVAVATFKQPEVVNKCAVAGDSLWISRVVPDADPGRCVNFDEIRWTFLE